MVTDPHVVARHTALVTQLQKLRRDEEEQERGEQTITACLRIASAFPFVAVAVIYGHVWTRGIEWIGLAEGVMRKIAGS
jgi:hypothetical protein